MGILDAMEEAAKDDETETETPETEAQVEEKPQVVQLAKPAGRRSKAREAEETLANEMKTLRETFTSSQSKFQEELSRRDQEIARLRGGYDALVQQRREPETPKVDPKALRKAAQEKLDKGDFAGWQEDYTNSVLIEAEERVSKLIPKPTQAPAPVPYAVQAVVNQFPDVMSAVDSRGTPIGWEKARRYDELLALDGIPDGPERYKKAFEMARAALPKNGKPGFSQSARGVLSAVPPARSGGGESEEGELGVEITPYMRQVAEKCGMTIKEYAQYYAEANPKAVRRG